MPWQLSRAGLTGQPCQGICAGAPSAPHALLGMSGIASLIAPVLVIFGLNMRSCFMMHREREREIQYVHSASLTYEDGALFMSQPSESRLSYSHRQPAGPCAKQKTAWHLQSSHTIEQTGL